MPAHNQSAASPGAKLKRTDAVREMLAFDQLPRILRVELSCYPTNLDSESFHILMRTYSVDYLAWALRCQAKQELAAWRAQNETLSRV